MALQDTIGTRLGKVVAPLAQAHFPLSGVAALADGRDAFAARMLLAEAAECTLDVQYYIWHNDLSGTLLLDALRCAADRGVRVRLLLDDNNTVGLDTLLAALDAHPQIEVRLFNPFKARKWRILDYVIRFARMNRRMHNKSFTADQQVTVVGGRNVGDEYFDAGAGVLCVDLDVMAIGPVVNDVSQDFERYWASASSCPASRVLPRVDPASLASLRSAASGVRRSPAAQAYVRALSLSPFVARLLEGNLPLEWAATQMLSDSPAKGMGRAADDELLWQRLKQLLGRPKHELELVSAYFVPTAAGVRYFTALAQQRIKVSILTNSLEATDVPVVHAGYAKWRKPLLGAGVALFEIKKYLFVRPSVKNRGLMGSSSSSSLHAKTFSVDRTRVFVGSFNFDPRSERLNTEMGFVIDSPALAQTIADRFAAGIQNGAYKLHLSGAGALQWVEQGSGKPLVHDKEPGSSLWLRAGVAVLSLLPIDWLL